MVWAPPPRPSADDPLLKEWRLYREMKIGLDLRGAGVVEGEGGGTWSLELGAGGKRRRWPTREEAVQQIEAEERAKAAAACQVTIVLAAHACS